MGNDTAPQHTNGSNNAPHKGERLEAYSLRPGSNGAIWVHCGHATVNHDGSISVDLDVLPLDGKLRLRRPLPRIAITKKPANAA